MAALNLAADGSEAPTQLDAIRDCMLRAAGRGEWLTLDEIAGTTEFGEASVSAQLRHLRKARHGRYRVEKRRRRSGKSETGRDILLWEYQVSLPLQGSLRFPAALRRKASDSIEVESVGGESRDAEARS